MSNDDFLFRHDAFDARSQVQVDIIVVVPRLVAHDHLLLRYLFAEQRRKCDAVVKRVRLVGEECDRARRIVLALGNRGTPMKLRVPGEEIKITRAGRTEDKVKYKLTDPEVHRKNRVIVVGAGNSAIEAAVDLVARRNGDQITFRSDDEINEVALVIRSDMKNDLKFLNKLQVYQCIDEGRIKVYFGTAIKEIRDAEVVLMNARTSEEKVTIPNDFIFAMIGGDRPTKFLESIGIKIA